MEEMGEMKEKFHYFNQKILSKFETYTYSWLSKYRK